MNTLAIVLIAAVCLAAAYLLYGRWLANKWGIDPAAKKYPQKNQEPAECSGLNCTGDRACACDG